MTKFRVFIFTISTLAVMQTTQMALAEPLKATIDKSDDPGMIGVRREWDGTISRVFPGSPADLGGLQVGDSIIEIDGVAKDATTPGSVIGEPGTTVKLTIKRRLLEPTDRNPAGNALLTCGLPVYCFVRVELVRVLKSTIKID